MIIRRPPFTEKEKNKIEKMILSQKYTDESIAKKMKCSKTTIKIIRTGKYKQLKKKRRKYSEDVKRSMLIMYKEDNMKIIDIARRLRIKYWTVWEHISRSGLKDEEKKKKTARHQHIINREFFNYSNWLKDFLFFLGKKLRLNRMNLIEKWMNKPSSQKELHDYIKIFNKEIAENAYIEKGDKENV